jgi:hypothetical protein
MMATRSPTAAAAARMFSITRLWLSTSPWAKFRRATFMPFRIIRSSVSRDSEADPIVQTILVFLGGKRLSAIVPPGYAPNLLSRPA